MPIIQNAMVFIFSRYVTFVFDTLKTYSSILGAGNDLHSDLHTAVIASQY